MAGVATSASSSWWKRSRCRVRCGECRRARHARGGGQYRCRWPPEGRAAWVRCRRGGLRYRLCYCSGRERLGDGPLHAALLGRPGPLNSPNSPFTSSGSAARAPPRTQRAQKAESRVECATSTTRSTLRACSALAARALLPPIVTAVDDVAAAGRCARLTTLSPRSRRARLYVSLSPGSQNAAVAACIQAGRICFVPASPDRPSPSAVVESLVVPSINKPFPPDPSVPFAPLSHL